MEKPICTKVIIFFSFFFFFWKSIDIWLVPDTRTIQQKVNQYCDLPKNKPVLKCSGFWTFNTCSTTLYWLSLIDAQVRGVSFKIWCLIIRDPNLFPQTETQNFKMKSLWFFDYKAFLLKTFLSTSTFSHFTLQYQPSQCCNPKCYVFLVFSQMYSKTN